MRGLNKFCLVYGHIVDLQFSNFVNELQMRKFQKITLYLFQRNGIEFLILSFNSLQSVCQGGCSSAERVNYHNVFQRKGMEREHRDHGDFVNVWLPRHLPSDTSVFVNR